MAHRENTRFSRAMWKVPATFTPLLGREREVAAIGTFLTQTETRLLTLTGAAGIGKTRLSLEVAKSLRSSFADGVCFVELAALHDPGLVIPTLARELGIREEGPEPLAEQMKRPLRDKHLLLVLDNFEHLLSAAPEVEELLAACPTLKIIVTSRSALRVQAEYLFPVAPLALPDLSRLPEPEVLTHTAAAVALFVQRAQTIRPDFQLTAANARTIAEICVRLDGLPLALELAAARVSVLSPPDLLAHLSSRLRLLTRGAWRLPERHQTLRKAIGWSYDLLQGEEQRLFRCLSVFVGNCTLEAIEAVCAARGDAGVDVLNGVASLLDNSLVQQQEQTNKSTRFAMLETIREYGVECLAAAGEEELTRQAYAAYYLALAEEAERAIQEGEAGKWLTRLEPEQENMQAVLRWFLDRGEWEAALRLGTALAWFWDKHGYLSEGRRWLHQALVNSHEVAPLVRARALNTAGRLARSQGDVPGTRALGEESLQIFRAQGDQQGIARALNLLGYAALAEDDLVKTSLLAEESLILARTVGDRYGIADALLLLGYCHFFQGRYASAPALHEESLALYRELGDADGIASSLFLLGRIHLVQGNLMSARAVCEESLVMHRAGGDRRGRAMVLQLFAEVALHQGEDAAARSLAEEALALFRELGDKVGLTLAFERLGGIAFFQEDYATAWNFYKQCWVIMKEAGILMNVAQLLERVAAVAAAQGQPVRAAQLWGAAQAWREARRTSIFPVHRARYEHAVAAVRSQLGEAVFAEAWARGRTMTPEQALAQEEVTLSSQPIPPEPVQTSPIPAPIESPGYPAGLTAREVEVLRLVAQGLTNVQIAERLIVSPHTVHAHIRSIHSKLGVTSRSAATRFAFEQKLVP